MWKRRRWRVRRKRSRGSGGDVGADDAVELGCCLFELVASAAVFLALILVPASLWLG